MAEYVWKHLPYAIYLDTNTLRSTGLNLDAPWINELLSITKEYYINLCISELVLTEWCEHIIEVLKSNRDKLLSSIRLLKDYDIHIPEINPDEVILPEKTQLIEVVSKKMKTVGFSIIQNWDGPLSQLLSEAVAKKPPFEQGGKGLCDVVILESYIKHAKDNLHIARVLVISNDEAMKRSEVRFKERGIIVDFISNSEIVEKLKSLLTDEVSAYIESKKSRLKEYVLTKEAIILDFIRSTPLEITDWMLINPFINEEDRIEGTIKSIFSIRPTKITDVIGGSPVSGEEIAPNRYPVNISVEIELDIVFSKYYDYIKDLVQTRAIVQPDKIDRNSPVTLERNSNWKPQEITKTIIRSLTLLATLDAKKEENDIFDDFRIEKII
jgi:hypothetical protein